MSHASSNVMIYKLCSAEDWATCMREGQLPWAPVDARDGFVHLSTGTQLLETAHKHFRGRPSLMLLEVDSALLPEDMLRWEVSRGGELFPHLYAALPHAAVVRAQAAPLDDDGLPQLPFGVPPRT